MDETVEVAYTLTDDMDLRAQVASLVGCSLSLLLCLFIIVASAWIYSIPSARHHLDRVSFRLLLWSMAVEMTYNGSYLWLYSDPIPRMPNPAGCTAGVYFLLASMSTANWLCTFIGVNLMLAICFGVNPVRARLERWYVGISFLIGFVVTLIPAALGDFGTDTEYEACYFTETDQAERVQDYILDLYLWQMLSSLIAAASVLAVLITLFRQSRATRRVLFRSNLLHISPEEIRAIADTTTTTSTSALHPSSNDCTPHWPRRVLQRITGRRNSSTSTKVSNLHRLEDKFITIALKISLYPLALIIINVFITAEDLMYALTGGVESPSDYAVYCIYYFLYGGRAMFFALLGIFVDPCLRRGLPAAYNATFRRSHDDTLPIASHRKEDAEKACAEGESFHAESLSDFLSSPVPLAEGQFSTSLSIPEGESRSMEKGGDGKRWLGRGFWGRRRNSQVDMEEHNVGVEEEKGSDAALDIDIIIPHTTTMTLPTPVIVLPPSSYASSSFRPDTPLSLIPPIPSLTGPAPSHLPRPIRPLLAVVQPRTRLYAPEPSRTRSYAPEPTRTRSYAPEPTPSAWIQPLANAILSPESRRMMPRRSSDPAIGDTYRRHRDLLVAAEKMYAEVQAQL